MTVAGSLARSWRRPPPELLVVARSVALAGSIGGAVVALGAAAVLVGGDGGLAYDTRAYWLAGGNVLHGSPLYAEAGVSTLGAFKYPPLFAQLFAPFSLLPELLVAWLWRLTSVLSLRYLAGSWRAALLCCLLPPVLRELSLGNVTLQIGAVLLFALRDRRGAWLVPWAAALKFGPALIVPYLWLRRPDSRRPLVLGSLVFGAACLASFAVAPGLWRDYLATFGWETASQMQGDWVIAIVAGSGGLDFAIRGAIAAALVLLATWRDWAWLAYAASVVTCPILALSRLAPLVALWRFRPETRSEAMERAQAAPRPAGQAAGAGS